MRREKLSNAEILIQRASMNGQTTPPGSYYTECGSNTSSCGWKGDFLAQYNNREIDNGRVVNLSRFLTYKNTPSVVLYTIFEHDNWPASVKNIERTINGARIDVSYRSYQSPYDIQIFTPADYIDVDGVRFRTSLSIDNLDIKYNFN